MQIKISRWCFLSSVLFFSQHLYAKQVKWCVYDFSGENGDIMQIMKDHALAAKKWGVETQLSVYREDQLAAKAFREGQCDGVVASTFTTRQYHHFMGTINAVGLIANHQVAYRVFDALAEPKYAKFMRENEYESVGWIPIGAAYFMVKDRSINSITHLAGLNVGVMREDPSQSRIARRVGAIPHYINFKNAATQFIKGHIDVLPAPIYAYQAFELHKGLGHQGGVINYPISYISMTVMIKHQNFPKHYGQRSRQWFKQRTPAMMSDVMKWERTLPNKYWYDLPASERQSYQRLVLQMRKDFIESKIYNNAMVNLVLEKHCEVEGNYFECKN